MNLKEIVDRILKEERNCWNAISESKINCPMPDYKLLCRNYK